MTGSETIGRPRPLVVIGGGVAGVASAIEAARCGLSSTILDERPDPESSWSEDLRRERDALADRIDVASGVGALAVSGEREILWASGGSGGTFRGESGVFRAGGIVLATGGSTRVVPFPGSTLPAVLRGEAVREEVAGQTQAYRGRRVLVAGVGPRLRKIATDLLRLGAEVVGVLDAGVPPRGTGPVGAGHAGADRDRLEREGVPILAHHAIFAARGDDRDGLDPVTFGPVDPEDGRPRRDEARREGVHRVVLDFGQSPRAELSVLAGCEQRFDEITGEWGPTRAPDMRTTVPGILSAGDGAGVASWMVAEIEGRIAGITAAEDAGSIGRAEAEARRADLLAPLSEAAATRSRWEHAYRLRPGWLELIEPDTVICSCEGTTLAGLRAARDEGARDFSSIKLLSRLGMGPCQGRECGAIGGLIAAREVGRPSGGVGRINPRPPVRPVTLGALARMRGVARPRVSDPGDALGGRVS